MDIDKAIEILTDCITEDIESMDALRYTQAALNLAHAKTVIQTEQSVRPKKVSHD